jgi:hypothetical protein
MVPKEMESGRMQSVEGTLSAPALVLLKPA